MRMIRKLTTTQFNNLSILNVSSRSLVSFNDFFNKKSEEKSITDEKLITDDDFLSVKDTQKQRLTKCKPYSPLSSAQLDIKKFCQEEFGSSFKEDSFNQLSLKDPNVKFSLLTKCIEHFKHDIPNSALNDIKTVQDLVEYFLTEVKDTNALEDLHQKSNLPKNLHINLEYKRFDPDTDTLFNGRDAYPKRDTIVTSLWYSKKYKSVIKKKDYFSK